MKPRPFDYVRPDTVEEALALLAEYGDDARILDGGQSLIPMLNLRLIEPVVLIDVSRIGALDIISDKGGKIRPEVALNALTSSPVTLLSVRIGVPIAPQATGAVLAIRQSVAAWNGSNPSPIRNEPAIATGAPPPPVTARTSGSSELGSACAIEPHTVPRLRVWKWPT